MDLKEIRYFKAIAHHGTMGKAAAHLRIAQPALTRQVQKLEHELGVQLLRRSPRGVALTPAGEVLVRRTDTLEAELDDIRREIATFSDHVTGSLHVAAQYPLAQIMMPELLREYNALYPDVSLHIVENVSRHITDQLLDGMLDIAIVDAPSHEHADVTIIPLWIEPLFLVGNAAAAKLPLFQKGFASIDDLAEIDLIMPSKNHALRHLTDAAFTRAKHQFHPAMEVDGAITIIELVEQGFGYTLLPTCGFYGKMLKGTLATLPVRPEMRRVISLVVRTVLLEDRKAEGFVRRVTEMAPKIAAMPRLGAVLHGDSVERAENASKFTAA
ncbi:LysR family transcriptional regulator [Sphingopyxis sp. MC1]|uniref:LysR family transcriptional regulator n=1 Tax=Sphingopyxis sp. MC1 TaxID=1174684 RepID=UPI0002D17B93|nr:LysR family transcriptional regulator [Sphingopyxis sp. MC1]ENY80196.1 LysR family transcriptional regulator [Sphingopyxis sp. MC1]